MTIPSSHLGTVVLIGGLSLRLLQQSVPRKKCKNPKGTAKMTVTYPLPVSKNKSASKDLARSVIRDH